MQHEQHHTGHLYRAIAGALVLWSALAALAWRPAESPQPPGQRQAMDAGAAGRLLLSAAVTSPPVIDGMVEAAWQDAQPIEVELHLGLHGDEPAGTVEMRSLHDALNVYFLLRWPAAAPHGAADTWRNLLTVHWGLIDPGLVSGESTGSEGLACTVGCHTATADGVGHLVGMRAETIPPGPSDGMQAGGGWSAGTWTVEWSRARSPENLYDQPMTDPALDYPFFVKLFEGVEGRPDPVSGVHTLRLLP